ncbi:MAG: NUDIX hydrolase [Deltaproteobacteria bacterium]|nr:NUDIX hydrolase [Deltaproteobacteria bacterium]
MAPKKWEIIASGKNSGYRVFDLRTDTARSPRTGNTHDFFIIESPAWVNIIPLTAQEEVVMIEQYRHGTRDITLEIPGGMVEPNEEPSAAALREMLEETGYCASTAMPLGFVHPNPAIQNNACFSFWARDVLAAGKQTLDEREDIQVVLKPLKEIPELIRSGAITHSLVIVAFYRFFAERFR